MLDRLDERHPFVRRVVRGKPSDRPLVGVSPGSGLIAATAAAAGADIFFVFSAGAYRSSGVGSLASFLPYGNANDMTEELLRRQVLPHAGEVPVVAGVMASDPAGSVSARLHTLSRLGVNAVTNWPATGLTDGTMRRMLAENGLDHDAECAMLAAAKEAGFAVFGFALTPEEVEGFCRVGVDGLILNVGLTRTVSDAVEKKNELRGAAVVLRSMWEVVERQPLRPLSFLFGGSITQPIDLEELLHQVPVHGYAGGSAFERIPVQAIVDSTIRRLKAVSRVVRHEGPRRSSGRSALVGSSRPMHEVRRLIDRAAPHDVSVCVVGETGTGKELVAQALHEESPRREMPFITMNCGAIPDSLVESEFFGHEKGAFTGAVADRKGKFELANHGVLFLDEIGDLSPHGQVALLRVLQQGEVFRVGGQKPIRVDVRIVAATNRDLEADVWAGRFRADLFYRISTVMIRTAPLRERPGDIPSLVEHTLHRLSTHFDRRFIGITESFARRLAAYRWPGNVRELEHVLTRAAIMEDGAVLEGRGVIPLSGVPRVATDVPGASGSSGTLGARVPPEVAPGGVPSAGGAFEGDPFGPVASRGVSSGGASSARAGSESVSTEGVSTGVIGRDRFVGTGPAQRRRVAADAVASCGNNKSEAARLLGISRKTLYQWLKRPDEAS